MSISSNQVKKSVFSELLPTEIELSQSLDWLITLRWLAVLGALGAVFVPPLFLGIHFNVKPLLLIIGIIAGYNTIFFIYQRISKHSLEEVPGRISVSRMASLQITLDLIALMAMLHFSGGIENPFIFYFIFHMIIASILLPRRIAINAALFVIFLFCSMGYLEYRSILPHYPLINFASNGLWQDEYYLLGITFVFTTTVLIAVLMASHITERLRLRSRQIIEARDSLKEKSEQLEEAFNELKKTHEEKSIFMRVTAHELRSPLSTIQTNLKIILDGYVSKVDPEQREILARLEQRVMNLIEVVGDLLKLSQFESVREKLEVEDLDINQSLDEIVGRLEIRAKSKKIRITVEKNKTPLILHSNRDNMRQLFTNLIVNAIKYTPIGGKVNICLWENNKNIHGQVSDTGIGIPAESIDKIFNEFYRTEQVKSADIQGTGLGLAIVRRIIEAHNGRITVESSLGHGTKFMFSLPLKNNIIKNKTN